MMDGISVTQRDYFVQWTDAYDSDLSQNEEIVRKFHA
jgi:hypothetical protein